MRISIIGNVAGNAYGLAKFLRRLGVEADSYDFGGGNPMWLPWWEECADLEPRTDGGPASYEWAAVAARTGVRRPSWAKILGTDAAEPWYDTQEAFEADLGRFLPGIELPAEGRPVRPEAAAEVLTGRSDAEVRVLAEALPFVPSWRSVRAIARRYDLTVLCGQTAGYGAFLPEGTPYVAFEHATMRYVHRLHSPAHRLLALAYRKAAACVVTNADCREAAECLGLMRHRFIPHPLDEDRYCPGPSVHGASIRDALGVDLLFYAPARHSMSESAGTKRNERVLYAFARYVREAVPAGAPSAALILAAWGHHVGQSLRLVDELGIGAWVKWTDCLPKPQALDLYRAADVVLDQFSETVGSFGTTTAEALAVGTPVITHVDPAVHEWCLPVLGELPPVWPALRTEEVYRGLCALARSPDLRSVYGRQGREWIERRHGWRQTAERHLALYREILGEPAAPPAPVFGGSGVVWTDAGAIGVGALSVAEPVAAGAAG